MRPDSPRRVALGAELCLILIAPGVVAALGDLFAWPRWIPMAGFVAAFVLSFWLLGSNMSKDPRLRVTSVMVVAVLAACFWMIAMMYAPRLTILQVRGETMAASVVDHEVNHVSTRSGGYDRHCYRMQRDDATPIFGSICRDYEEFTVGETITILVDPGGHIAPETPDEIDDAGNWQIMGLVSLGLIIVLSYVSAFLAPLAPHRRTISSLRQPDQPQ